MINRCYKPTFTFKYPVRKRGHVVIQIDSSCIYPRLANQPIKETELMQGALEPTNEPYALAKIAGIKLCESYNRQYGTDYRSIMPTNLYGPRDNYHPQNSHVIPALLRRFHEAKLSGAGSITVIRQKSPTLLSRSAYKSSLDFWMILLT